ncbi:MAG: iron-containing alcohol dehydrogenase [Synergistaceae bacterium]|jgi:alcohol dehydrogenase|nr:iron-containing alcohol dehydrogenase [Acidaminococcaceae bacterium]MBP9974837.1 iron-containing alcohol dehydrogenase [Synergistaceae bacterium]PKL03680.1 MAG: alcohol dehydrogenase [Synergistetes bacterium HGW-Synergistetes-1]MCE5184372.1 iron-containing alcohol dehydrogenase [Synergistaceae bacterium]MDD4750680.1 iron-containing alcohol dehydrogenase [Synergistaceae bacterium]
MWEKENKINEVREIRCRTIAYLGVGAINKIVEILGDLKKKGISKVIVVSGRGSYKKTGAWDVVKKAFNVNKIDYVLYDKVTPNPTVDSVDEATALAREFRAQAVIAIGGGSPIDTGKSVAILMENPKYDARQLYEYKFTPERAAPIVAINLTHGTGSEVNRFAVVSLPEKDYKPAIAYDCIYPLYAIDDPALMTKLSPEQTKFVSIDAVNHVIEAATSKVASPYTILLAQETIRLVDEWLPKAMQDPDDLEARYYLLYASMIGGIAFDNGMLHLTHALEHPLSGVKPELTHGLGLAMILPAVVEVSYPAVPKIFADILTAIVPGLKGVPEEASKAAAGVEKWLVSMGTKEKLSDEGFKEEDIMHLVNLAQNTPSLGLLLSLAPIEVDDKVIEKIYRDSMFFKSE